MCIDQKGRIIIYAKYICITSEGFLKMSDDREQQIEKPRKFLSSVDILENQGKYKPV
jgi:hypothetical protein